MKVETAEKKKGKGEVLTVSTAGNKTPSVRIKKDAGDLDYTSDKDDEECGY